MKYEDNHFTASSKSEVGEISSLFLANLVWKVLLCTCKFEDSNKKVKQRAVVANFINLRHISTPYILIKFGLSANSEFRSLMEHPLA
jgi:hypothetical protein